MIMKKIFSPDENLSDGNDESYFTDDWSERKLLSFLNHNINKARYYIEIKLYIVIFLLILILIFK